MLGYHADIHVLDLTDGRETPVVSGAGGEYLLAWGPQGIFYFTMENGSSVVWLQRMQDGRRTGTAQRVVSEVWGIWRGMGVGGDRLFYGVPTREMQVMEVATGTPDAAPTPISEPIRGDWVANATWAPDGSILAYSRREFWPQTDYKQTLVLREAATGQERVMPTPFFTIGNMAWERDGRGLTVLGVGRSPGVQEGLRRMALTYDLATGSFQAAPTAETTYIPLLSPDRRT